MREGLDRPAAPRSTNLRRSARAAAAPRARAPRPPRPRPQPRHRLSGRAAAVDEVHGALLRDAAARLPRPDPRGDRRRPARGAVPTRHQGDRDGQDAVRRARRNGDQLDPQPPPLLARGRRRRRSSISSSTARGRGRWRRRCDRWRCSAPARWARRSPRTSRTPACRSLLLDLTADAARDGLKRARALKPDPFFTPDALALITTGGFDTDLAHSPTPTGSSKRSSSSSTSSARCSSASSGARRRHDRLVEHLRHSDRDARRGPQRRFPAALARHALLQPAALPAAASRSSRPPTPTRPSSTRVARSPITASARASSSRRTRRTSSATTSALYGVDADAAGARSRRATPSKRSTRSPARRSAGRRARRSGRWTSPASTSWRTSRRTSSFELAGVRERRMIANGLDRREGRAGILQARQERGRQPRS